MRIKLQLAKNAIVIKLKVTTVIFNLNYVILLHRLRECPALV